MSAVTMPPDPAGIAAPAAEPERPTLKAIAAATGLTVVTVSSALRDAPDIGENTKRRVQETAELLGYRPNCVGERQRTGKTNVIALALSTKADVMNHTSRLICSIADGLRGTAYHMVVMPHFPDQDPMDPIRYMTEHGFPVTTHGRTDMCLDNPYFDFDNEAFSCLAIRTPSQRGRRRLMLVAPPRSHLYARHMTCGFSDKAALLCPPFQLAGRVTSDSAGDAIEEEVTRRLAEPDPPEGLVVGSTTAAMAVIAGAEPTGRVLGRDFDVVAKEVIPILRRFHRDILIVREDVGRAGDFLARALVATIEKRTLADRQGLEMPERVEWGPGPRKGGIP
ncbi:LacI family DNA-binding transcriptional regulator [Tabrizicola caldifontis]|uniref:LacI family DNA-binding transcriptional regulator n=1 Tax=Tabrizicola caldifontis TaxID=2528036 RepID=UPI0010812E32|nr:LacI family DNA-binding transcriptional regulator [Rhodobacter sp. YIM 73028]